jgi:RimJ/RimL family protein N-acetyltransferase
MSPTQQLFLVPLRGTEDPDSFVTGLSAAYLGNEHHPRALLELTKAFLEANPRSDPWGSYIAYDATHAVGTCAYKSAPDGCGAVEIAYSTFPAHEGQGYAKCLISLLVGLAFRSGATRVFAHTLPETNASNSALKSQGFVFRGEVLDPEDGQVWRWDRCVSEA